MNSVSKDQLRNISLDADFARRLMCIVSYNYDSKSVPFPATPTYISPQTNVNNANDALSLLVTTTLHPPVKNIQKNNEIDRRTLPEYHESLTDYFVREELKKDVERKEKMANEIPEKSYMFAEQLREIDCNEVVIGQKFVPRVTNNSSHTNSFIKKKIEADLRRQRTGELRRKRVLEQKKKANEEEIKKMREEIKKERELFLKLKHEEEERRAMFSKIRLEEIDKKKIDRENAKKDEKNKLFNALGALENIRKNNNVKRPCVNNYSFEKQKKTAEELRKRMIDYGKDKFKENLEKRQKAPKGNAISLRD